MLIRNIICLRDGASQPSNYEQLTLNETWEHSDVLCHKKQSSISVLTIQILRMTYFTWAVMDFQENKFFRNNLLLPQSSLTDNVSRQSYSDLLRMSKRTNLRQLLDKKLYMKTIILGLKKSNLREPTTVIPGIKWKLCCCHPNAKLK